MNSEEIFRKLQETGYLPASEDKAFLIFLSVIVGSIVLCYLIFMLQCLRFYIWPTSRPLSHTTDQASLDSRIFNLNTRQRRAVLETFFSVKAVTSQDDFRRKNDSDESEKSKEIGSVPPAADSILSASAAVPSIFSVFFDDEVSTRAGDNDLTLKDDMGDKNAEKQENTTTLLDEAMLDVSLDLEANVDTKRETSDKSTNELKLRKKWRPFWQRSSASLDPQNEQDKDQKCSSEVDQTIDLSQVYSENDEDEPVCAICICEYEDGELIIHSKHCSHMFHKDCIFEWLDKHDVCPICREEMITDGELNSTAITVVGKERMVRAVASLASSRR